jgi:hypothetical protein
VQDKAVSYARGVVEEEWPSMRRGVASQHVGRLLEMDSIRLHAVAGLTVLVSLILHVIGVLDYPFDSGVRVQPTAFEQVLVEVGATPIPDRTAPRSTAP